MSEDAFPVRVTEPELVASIVKFVGGTAAVTKVYGTGVTVTYISAGIVDLTWGEAPGAFVGVLGRCFEATTASGVKGYTMVPGVFNTTTLTLRLNMTNAAENLTDLAALQWLTVTLGFKRTAA